MAVVDHIVFCLTQRNIQEHKRKKVGLEEIYGMFLIWESGEEQ